MSAARRRSGSGPRQRRPSVPAAGSARYGAPAPPQDVDPFDGVLLVDKPAGPTSHDVVDAVRDTFGLRKVGHGGTLDPQATGLLILLTGRGTKLSNRFLSSDKTYLGVCGLGLETDTQDAEGRVTARRDFTDVSREAFETACRARIGDQFQTPPMISAVKVDGQPLYKRGRKGQDVAREPRLIHVYEFAVCNFEPPWVSFRLRCTKGTYVRTLCADIGAELGCGAYLAQLQRTRSGSLALDEATPLEDLLKLSKDELREKILPMHRFLRMQPHG